MKKKLLSLCMACALCAGLLAVPAAAVSGPAWAGPVLARWEACGKLNTGVDTAKTVTGAEAAALFERVLPEPVSAGLSGEGVLSREALAVAVAKAFGFTAGGAPDFQDAAAIAAEAAGAVAILQQKGVMQGSEGYFRPKDAATYAEVVQALSNAVGVSGPVTGVSVRPRSAEGVLASGQPTQLNDGKFELVSVQKTAEGYAVVLKGTAPLVGQKADEMAAGEPELAGKWMGIQLRFHGLVRADELQYSKDGTTWTSARINDAFAGSAQYDSIMLYVGATKEADEKGDEVEKDTVLYVRNGEDGQQIKFDIHYTPAA